MQRFQMYIDGEFVDSSSAEWFDSYNPYTGDVWCQIAQGEAEDADRAVQAAHRAFSEGPWSKLTHSGRGALLHKLGDLIAREAGKLAETEVRDHGKQIGRASCRERVCKYVSSSAVHGTLKTRNKVTRLDHIIL